MQELARYSSVTLSRDRYTHAGADELAGALEKLPPVSGEVVQELYKDLSRQCDCGVHRVALNGAKEEMHAPPDHMSQVVMAQ